MKYRLALLLLSAFILNGHTQNVNFSIHGAYTKAIKQEKLISATTLADLITGYPASWITDYLATEILVSSGDDIQRSVGTNDTLTMHQKEIIAGAHLDADIVLDVAYRYKNSITGQMDLRTLHYTATVVPEIEATYTGGAVAMNDYLKANTLQPFPDSVTRLKNQMLISFIVSETGAINNVKLTTSSGYPDTDRVLLEAITRMPAWKPAEDRDGHKVKQEFEFTLGNIGC